MTEKLDVVRDYCCECSGEGEVSRCCQAEIDDNRCLTCGRFCKTDVCYSCEGYGYTEYRVGDEVEIFVCVWSEDYLQDSLYKPKAVGDTKTFEAEILEFPDKWNAVVKVGKKKINVKLEDLSIR